MGIGVLSPFLVLLSLLFGFLLAEGCTIHFRVELKLFGGRKLLLGLRSVVT